MKNYLFSTTRQWNPGDEFILQGILRIFRHIDKEFNPVIFNRNPEIKHRENAEFNIQFDIPHFRFKKLRPGFYDNSFKKQLLPSNFITLAVFAGTSEWASARMKVLYDYLEKHSIPTIYLGIGVGSENFDFEKLNERYKTIIKRSLLITVRDHIAEKTLAGIKAVYLPCPVLLSAPPELEIGIRDVSKVGLIYMVATGAQSNKLDEKNHNFLLKFYKEILRKYKNKFRLEFICHYINELADFQKDFPDEICHYSYDSLDYLNIYHQFDFIAGPRVHGIGIAASMGIPGIGIQHDVRANTCYGFLADIISPSMGVDGAMKIFNYRVERLDREMESKKLLAEKQIVFNNYVNLLRPILQTL